MYEHDPAAQKLWKMARRCIAENNYDVSAISGDHCRPVMYALEAAGALNLPEDAPLPAITWPPEATHAKTATVPRKPMGIAESDLENLRRHIGGTE
jgi:hypothetical protein